MVIVGLIGSGLSALPLLHEVATMDHSVHELGFPPFITTWIEHVHQGLEKTYAAYPFIAYGTDWLAFGYFVIALFRAGAFIDPMRNVWIIHASMIACVLVIPTALIAGFVHEIPVWWRTIDSSFATVGLIPLCLAERLIQSLPTNYVSP
jgi:hypothetical protein